jgi:uncharacterized protein (DUF433 family)
MKNKVISLRLPQGAAGRLERLARLFRRSVGETAALLLEEKLKEEDFAFIEFRDSAVGRHAYVQGTSLAVWEVVLVARGTGTDAGKTAKHLEWPIEKVQAALAYAAAHPDEIDPVIEEVESITAEQIQAALPWARRVP